MAHHLLPRRTYNQTRLDPIPDASHTRDRKSSPPDSNCLPGTREGVLEDITAWADKNLFSSTSHVYWLYGYVGCGKSSISQAVAERFRKKGRLVASFFFFRSSERRSSFKSFPATLASQMAAAIPATAPLILANLKAQAGLLSYMSVGAQMELLVYKPFETAVKGEFVGSGVVAMFRKPFLITIDGLDECKDKDKVTEFIRHMLSYFRENPSIPLRFLIASRVEEHIRTRLATDQVRLENLVDHSPLEDIRTFIRATFAEAAEHDRVIKAYGDWPGITNVRCLARVSGGSFIFISMLLKYILSPSNDDKLTPKERLPLALNMTSGLDHLYAETLARSKDLPHFSSVLSALAYLRKPLSTSGMAQLLGIKLDEVIAVLVNLHAIIQLPGDDSSPITLCHTSLHDFLTTENRSGTFFCPPVDHECLAYRCLDRRLVRYSFLWGKHARGYLEAVEYARLFMCTHFELASNAIGGNPESLQCFYDRVVAYMCHKFPTPSQVPVTVSAYFMVNMMGGPSAYPWAVGVLSDLLTPMVPASHSVLIAKVLAAVVKGDSFHAHPHQFLRECLEGTRPELLDPIHHTFLVKQCVRYLIDPWNIPSVKQKVDRVDTLKYVLSCWAKHLELALVRDPAMDLEVLYEDCSTSSWIPGSPRSEGVTCGDMGPLIQALQKNVALAVEAIENKFPGTVVSDSGLWINYVETDTGGYHLVQGKFPLSIMALLHAFQQVKDPGPEDNTFTEMTFEVGSSVLRILQRPARKWEYSYIAGPEAKVDHSFLRAFAKSFPPSEQLGPFGAALSPDS